MTDSNHQPPNGQPLTLTPHQIAEVLTNLKPGVKLNLEILPSGDVAVSNDTPKTKADYLAENPDLAAKLAPLEGQPITAPEAAEKYEVLKPTLFYWKNKGFITVLEDDGYRMTFDEADVAYCVHIYEQRKASGLGYRGVPLLNEYGGPYQLKHKKLAQYRRRQKQAA